MTPLETVDSIYDAFKRRDFEFILSQVASDVSWQGPKSVPWGGKHTGPEGVKDFFAKLGEVFELTGLTLDQRVASGDRVVTLGSYEGKGRKTGKTASTDYCWVWQVKNGKISSYQGHFDTSAILAALN